MKSGLDCNCVSKDLLSYFMYKSGSDSNKDKRTIILIATCSINSGTKGLIGNEIPGRRELESAGNPVLTQYAGSTMP